MRFAQSFDDEIDLDAFGIGKASVLFRFPLVESTNVTLNTSEKRNTCRIAEMH